MLPKDLLKYAKKLSPQEIKQAIIDAVKGKPKSSTDEEIYMRRQLQQMNTLQSVSTSTGYGQFPTTTVTYLGSANTTWYSTTNI
jgi:hypothetical protein